MIVVDVTIPSTLITFTFQDHPQARIAVHQASAHPIIIPLIPFYDLAAFRLSRAQEGGLEVTPEEVRQAIDRFNAVQPGEGQVVVYKPDSRRWGR